MVVTIQPFLKLLCDFIAKFCFGKTFREGVAKLAKIQIYQKNQLFFSLATPSVLISNYLGYFFSRFAAFGTWP